IELGHQEWCVSIIADHEAMAQSTRWTLTDNQVGQQTLVSGDVVNVHRDQGPEDHDAPRARLGARQCGIIEEYEAIDELDQRAHAHPWRNPAVRRLLWERWPGLLAFLGAHGVATLDHRPQSRDQLIHPRAQLQTRMAEVQVEVAVVAAIEAAQDLEGVDHVIVGTVENQHLVLVLLDELADLGGGGFDAGLHERRTRR
ncbi:MAG: hypothetical protein KDK91_15395, partial [Gammaproteobacteria bacterium]|nr:hypothetical protein [Gammaproteobacteria bacterium]